MKGISLQHATERDSIKHGILPSGLTERIAMATASPKRLHSLSPLSQIIRISLFYLFL